MVSLDDTIVAISTPLGEGGIGIVRLTGPEAASILKRLFVTGPCPTAALRKKAAPNLQPRTLHYGHIVEPGTGAVVDEVLAVHMPAPQTYTRQDVIEINGHGGFVALQRIQSLCMRQGARLADPGEFTARAFLNGRLDLAQAEAVLDVVRAKTETSLQMAVHQLAGRLSDRVRSTRDRLLDVLAYLEVTIDFEEDEIPAWDIGPDLNRASKELAGLLAGADQGIIYRQGVRTAITGRPNVGKSSLLNQLLRTSRAIVTDIPGTTRDTLEETLNLQGIPVVLVDTAGITAQPQDPIERLGIERGRAALAQADLVLLVLDASEPLTDADKAIAALVGDKPVIVVLNKIDLLDGQEPVSSPILDATCVLISALTGQGLEDLEAAIVSTVLSGQATATEAPLVTSPRHKEALNRALEHVQAAHTGYLDGQLTDLLAIDVTCAVNALGEITGQTASEDLVETIFSNFCVGK